LVYWIFKEGYWQSCTICVFFFHIRWHASRNFVSAANI